MNQYGVRSLRIETLSPARADIGIAVTRSIESFAAKAPNSAAITRNGASSKPTRSILFTASTTSRMPSSEHDHGMPARLGEQALAGVDEQDGEIGGGGAGRHVAGVLDVARRVGDDEAAARRGEEAIGDVDGDALLALRLQPVDEQREVDVLAGRCRGGQKSLFSSST